MRRPATDRLRPLDPRLLRAAPALRRQVAFLVPLLLVRTACTVVGAGLLARSLVLVWRGEPGLTRPLLLLALVVALRAAVDGLVELLGGRAAEQVRGQLRAGVLGGLTRAGPRWLSGRATGSTAHTAGAALDGVDAYVTRVVPALVAAAVVPPLVLARIAAADLLSAVVLLVTLPLVPLFLALVGLTTRDRTQRSYDTLAGLAAKVLDLLQGLPTLKVHGRAAGQVAAVGRVTERYRQQTLAALRWAFLSGLVLDLLATLSVAIVAVGIGLRLQDGALALTPALVVLLLAPEVYTPLRAVGTHHHASADALEAAGAALALSSAPASDDQASQDHHRLVASLVDVTVQHPGRPGPALDAVCLALRPGEVISVEGPSGAGKSTLLAVLLGAVAPDGGAVTRSHPGRSTTAWAPQRPRPSAPTAGAEARLGDPTATSDQVEAALRDCDALPAGTPLGEGGRGVSAGQRRRVALARAVLRARASAAAGEHPLVLLDEPTEDLDAAAADVVARVVDGLRGTAAVVLVTHSPELARVADRHLRLEGGRLVADVRGAAVLPRPATAVATPVPIASAPVPAVPSWGPRSLLRAFRQDAHGLLPHTALALLLSGLVVTAGLVLAGCSAWLVLRAAQQPGLQVLALAVVGVRTAALAKALLRYAERLAAHDVALRLLTRTRTRVVAALVPLAPGGLDLWRRGDVLRRFTGDVDAVQDAVVRGVLPLAGAVTGSVAALGATAVLVPQAVLLLAVGLAATAAVAPLAALAGSRGTARAAALAASRDEEAVAWVEAYAELWAYDALDAATGRVLELDDRVARAGAPSRTAAAAAAVTGSLLAGLTPLAVLWSAAGHASGITAGVVALLSVVAVEPVAALAPAWAALGTSAQRAARVAALLASPAPVPDPNPARPAPPGPRGLDAVDASLGHAHPVLTGFALDVAPGTRVALVGPSGSGKSTVVAAALRLLRASSGAVRLTGVHDAVPVDRLDATCLPPLVCGVLQDDHLFATSLRENLRVGRPSATDGDLDDVAGRLGLLDWVRSLPDGWSTATGADGDRVSGGQRQRLLLARALLADPEVLVLDEPTAHLDPETEALVLADLLQATRGRTLLLSTHRTAGLHELDAVVHVTDGPLQRAGPVLGPTGR